MSVYSLSHLRIVQSGFGTNWRLHFFRDQIELPDPYFPDKGTGVGSFGVSLPSMGGGFFTLFNFQPNISSLPPNSPFQVLSNGDLRVNLSALGTYILKFRFKVLQSYDNLWYISLILNNLYIRYSGFNFIYNSSGGTASYGVSLNTWYEVDYRLKVRSVTGSQYTIDHRVFLYNISTGTRQLVGTYTSENQTYSTAINPLSLSCYVWLGNQQSPVVLFDYIRVAGSTTMDLYNL